MARSIFLPILTGPYASPMRGLQRALDFGATLGAEILASISELEVPPLVTPALPLGIDVATMAAEAEAASRARADELEHQLRHEAGRLSLVLRTVRTRSRQEWAGENMGAAARTHDLVLFCPGEGVDDEPVAEALIFGAGRPVVLIPDNDAPVHLMTVAVAWDGSRAAARAFHDALPLLQMAKRVVVLTAGSDKQIEQAGVAGVLDALERSAVQANRVEVSNDPAQTIGEALQGAALANDAGLLVMGGYGHSRMREFILGGATRSILKRQRLPVLLSH